MVISGKTVPRTRYRPSSRAALSWGQSSEIDIRLQQADAVRRSRSRIYATFSTRAGRLERKGPYARLRFESTVLRERARGPEIARYEDDEWRVGRRSFSRLDIEGRVGLCFVEGTERVPYGPCGIFSFVGGIVFRDGQTVAYIDRERNIWTRQDDGRPWPMLLLEPAP